LEKGAIIDEIRKISAPTDPREAFISIFSDTVLAAVGAAKVFRDAATGPVIGRLFRVAMDAVIHVLDQVLERLEGLAQPPFPISPIEEFDLVPSPRPTPAIPHDTSGLESALAALALLAEDLETARELLRTLFFSIDPVLSLAEGQITGALRAVGDSRALAVRLIQTHV